MLPPAERVRPQPLAWLMAWLCLMLVLPALSVGALLGVAAAVGLPMLAWARPILSHSVYRMRWLLLSLLLLMGWTLPGEALWDWRWAPTREGLEEGALHALRLLLAVWTVRTIWLVAGQEAMLAALYRLLAPFGRLGVPAERFALRLWLTLYYAEAMLRHPPRVSLEGLARLLREDVAPPPPDRVELVLCKWRWPDTLLCSVAVLTALAVLKG